MNPSRKAALQAQADLEALWNRDQAHTRSDDAAPAVPPIDSADYCALSASHLHQFSLRNKQTGVRSCVHCNRVRGPR